MLTIGYNTRGTTIEQYNQNFHVGYGRIREKVNECFSLETSLLVQADGHELEKIRQQFQNIPMTNNRVVRWTGNHARFIIENLDL